MKAARIIAATLVLAPLLTLAVMAAALHRNPRYFDQPGAGRFLVSAVIPLCVNAILPLILFLRFHLSERPAFQIATLAGCLLAPIDILGICLEDGFPITVHSTLLRAAPMAIVFLGWLLVASWWVRRSGRDHPAGKPLREAVAASVWTAIVTVAPTITAGALIELFLHPPASSYVVSWGEYQRSGWHDPALFAIANTFDSISSHLLLAPIVALTLGSIGAAVALATLRRVPPSRSLAPILHQDR